jgi:TnpA family transposase
LIRLATLSKSDLAFVRQHRGIPNRLGVAVQMVYLRHPGRALGVREPPHAPVLELVASQLDLTPIDWDAYAARGAARREHLAIFGSSRLLRACAGRLSPECLRVSATARKFRTQTGTCVLE